MTEDFVLGADTNMHAAISLFKVLLFFPLEMAVRFNDADFRWEKEGSMTLRKYVHDNIV